MKYSLNFIVDEQPETYVKRKYVKINRRNKDEVLRDYRETVYAWSLSRLTNYNPAPDFWGYQQSVLQKAGVLEADDVAGLLNAGYTFEFGFELKDGDVLKITYSYKNPAIIRRTRPYLSDAGDILLQFNGESWQQKSFTPYPTENLRKGILLVTLQQNPYTKG